MILNEKQQQAVMESNRDLLVLAGAGTGKTRVLTEKYLYLLESQGWSPQRIVAITFTQKAAFEMRTRIRESLEAKVLSSKTKEKSFWQDKLEGLSYAYIGTFHGFCQKLLKEFVLESGSYGQMAILSSGEERIILNRALERTCVRMATQGTEEENQAFFDAVIEWGLEFFTKDIGHLLPKLRESGASIEYWTQKTRGASAESVVNSIAHLEEAITALLQSEYRERLTPRGQNLLHQLESEKYAYLPNADAEISQVVVRMEQLRKNLPKNIGVAVRPHIDDLHEQAEKVRMAFSQREFERWLPVIERFLIDIDESYNETKNKEGKMDFADLQIRVRDLLLHNPEIRRECQERYEYFMVDEFQDTNRLQMEIVHLLVGDAHIGQGIGRLFVVGDPKQSIYRFRGAQVEVVEKLSNKLSADDGKIVALQENYRCHPAIIDGVNTVFSTVFADETIPYHPLIPGRQESPEDGGRWEIIVSPEGSRQEEAERIASYIRRTIDEGVAGPGDEREDTRTLRYGDIAILMRAMTHIELYERALRRYAIPYRLSGGIGYYGLQEVQDQLNLVRLIHNSQDSIALLALLRSPYCGWNDEDIYRLASSENNLLSGFYQLQSAPEGITDNVWERLLHLRQCITELQAIRGVKTVSEILQMAMDKLGYTEVICAFPHAERAMANIEKLLSKAEEFSSTAGRYGLGDFIDFIGELIAVDEREGEAEMETDDDGVRILTIHAAKGLEFPIVIVADMERRMLKPETAPILLHYQHGIGYKIPDGRGELLDSPLRAKIREAQKIEELSEEKRLFYVALTRAKEKLVLSGIDGQKNWDGQVKSWGDWLRMVLTTQTNDQYTLGERTVRVIDQSSAGTLADKTIASEDFLHQVAAGMEADYAEVMIPTASLFQKISVTSLLSIMKCPKRFNEIRHNKPSTNDELSNGKSHGALIGQIIHRLVALEDLLELDEVQAIIGRSTGMLPVEDQRIVGESVIQLWSSYMNSKYPKFKGKVFSEYEFIVPLGSCYLQGVMDRLMITEEGQMILVDFKTDQNAAKRMDQLINDYRPQLMAYAVAVRKIFGSPPMRAELYFLSADSIIEEQFSEETLDEWEKKLTETAVSWLQKDFQGICEGCLEAFHCEWRGRTI